MLTARQMITIATQSSVAPLHLSDLAKMYKISPVSLSFSRKVDAGAKDVS